MVLKIESLDLYPVYDSAGGQTLEASINGRSAACPGGISCSKYEAKVLPASQVLKTFEKVKKDFLRAFSQLSLDSKLEKLAPKLGAQATTAISLAFYDTEQSAKSVVSNTFPNLLGNVFGGGAHAPCKTRMTIQEMLVLPRAKTLAAAIETNFKIWHIVGKELAKRGMCGLNYECAWSADMSDDSALALLVKIAKKNRAQLGIDVAASQFFKKEKYNWSDKALSRDAHIERILSFVKKYKLAYVEDPVQQDDFEGFARIRKATKGKVLICGDDLVATNLDRLKRAARERAINAVIVKPNQVGTVSGSLAVIAHARKNKILPIISHRSRETHDTAICRLAQLCPIAKFGVAGIRTTKLNGLLRLWHRAPKPKIAV